MKRKQETAPAAGQRFLRAGLVYTVHEVDAEHIMFSVRGFKDYRCISRRQWGRLMAHGSELKQAPPSHDADAA